MPGRIRRSEIHQRNLNADAIGTTVLADGKILVGSGSNVATARTPSGDVTMTNLGAFAIGAKKVTSAMLGDGILHVDAFGPIIRANVIGTSAGQLGHANGVELVASPGAGYVLELVSAIVIWDYDTAAYGGGGNVTINIGGGGAALTGVVANSASFGAGADKIIQFNPLAAVVNQLTADKGLNLVAASAFTDGGGTVAGVIRGFVAYRVHATGL
jgi:hypothetical protein